MPSATLRVGFDDRPIELERTQSVRDGIPPRSVGTSVESTVVFSEKSQKYRSNRDHSGHDSGPLIDDPGGIQLAFNLAADWILHDVANPRPKRTHVRSYRDNRGDHDACDGIDGAAIGIGDRS